MSPMQGARSVGEARGDTRRPGTSDYGDSAGARACVSRALVLFSSSGEKVKYLLTRTNPAQVQVGTLLRKRMVKPASVMVQWGRQQNPAVPGVLSRGDFRHAMLQLFADRSGYFATPFSRASRHPLAPPATPYALRRARTLVVALTIYRSLPQRERWRQWWLLAPRLVPAPWHQAKRFSLSPQPARLALACSSDQRRGDGYLAIACSSDQRRGDGYLAIACSSDQRRGDGYDDHGPRD